MTLEQNKIKLNLEFYFLTIISMSFCAYLAILGNLMDNKNYTVQLLIETVYSSLFVFIFYLTIEFGIYFLICFGKRKIKEKINDEVQ